MIEHRYIPVVQDRIDLISVGKNDSTALWGTGILIQDPQTKKILLAQRTDTKQYAGPGGKVEFKESPLQAIVRETMEESKIEIVSCYCYDIGFHKDIHGRDWTSFFFFSNNFDVSNMNNDSKEMGKLNWYTLDEIKSLDLFPPCKIALNRANELGLLNEGNINNQKFVYFANCPASASAIMDSVSCQYSYKDNCSIFETLTYSPWIPWD